MRANCNNHLTAVHPKEACEKNHNQVASSSSPRLSSKENPSNKTEYHTNEFPNKW